MQLRRENVLVLAPLLTLAAAAMGRGGDPESEEPTELRNIANEIRARGGSVT